MSEVKYLSPDEFRKMQLLQLDMLKELDRVCRNNNIKYSIFAGSLLGAVRHKGYIPWDDDADIAMLREDYERFKEVSDQLDSSICYFQDHSTDPEYRWGYGKLRRTGTKFVRVGQEHLKCKTGVFIDIFPLDDIPTSTAAQMVHDAYCFFLRKVLWSEVGKYSSSEPKVVRWCYRVLSRIPTKFVFDRVKKLTEKSRNTSENRVRILLFPAIGKLYKKNPLKERYGMPKSWFIDLEEYIFEGERLFGTKDYDTALQYIYGDYMTPPPEDKRDPHAPVSDYSLDVDTVQCRQNSCFSMLYSMI